MALEKDNIYEFGFGRTDNAAKNVNLLDEAVNSLMASQSYLNKFAQNKILNWRLKNEN